MAISSSLSAGLGGFGPRFIQNMQSGQPSAIGALAGGGVSHLITNPPAQQNPAAQQAAPTFNMPAMQPFNPNQAQLGWSNSPNVDTSTNWGRMQAQLAQLMGGKLPENYNSMLPGSGTAALAHLFDSGAVINPSGAAFNQQSQGAQALGDAARNAVNGTPTEQQRDHYETSHTHEGGNGRDNLNHVTPAHANDPLNPALKELTGTNTVGELAAGIGISALGQVVGAINPVAGALVQGGISSALTRNNVGDVITDIIGNVVPGVSLIESVAGMAGVYDHADGMYSSLKDTIQTYNDPNHLPTTTSGEASRYGRDGAEHIDHFRSMANSQASSLRSMSIGRNPSIADQYRAVSAGTSLARMMTATTDAKMFEENQYRLQQNALERQRQIQAEQAAAKAAAAAAAEAQRKAAAEAARKAAEEAARKAAAEEAARKAAAEAAAQHARDMAAQKAADDARMAAAAAAERRLAEQQRNAAAAAARQRQIAAANRRQSQREHEGGGGSNGNRGYSGGTSRNSGGGSSGGHFSRD